MARLVVRALLALILLSLLAASPPGHRVPVLAADILGITPSGGPPGTPISISVDAGTFTPGSPVSATLQDSAANPSQSLGNWAAGADGSVQLASTIPLQVVVGAATITVSGVANGTLLSLHTTYLVQPAIVVTPNHGPAGASVAITIYGSGFGANAHVAFSMNGVPISGLGVATGSLGFFAPVAATVQVPTSGTPVIIGASDSTGAQAQAAFTVDAAVSSPATATATPTPAPAAITPTLILSPTVVPLGGTFSVTGNGFTPGHPISFTIGGVPAATTIPVAADAAGHFAMIFTLPTTVPLGPTVLTATDNTGTGVVQAAFTVGNPLPTATATATATSTPMVTTGASGVTNAYFAEGYTGQATTNGTATFNEMLNFLNPAGAPAPVTITYFTQDGTPPISVSRTIPASSSYQESVTADVGPDKIVGAQITSSQKVFVTRTIYRTAASGARLDGSTTLPASAPALTWAFPEGYTGISFQEYLTLLNPSTVPATVTVTLAPQADSAVGARVLSLSVPPQSRRTANIRALNLGNTARSVGMLVTSTVPIVAERVEYYGDGAGSGKFGSTVSSGITAPATQVRFPVLSSGGTAPNSQGQAQPVGDQAYITILNPASSGSPVQVAAAFAGPGGAPLGQPVTVDVPPGTRRTITVNTALGSGPLGPVSAVLNASGPIDAEAAQYAGGSPNSGPHPGIAFAGSATPTTDAFLTDLATALANGTPIKRSLFLFNPTNVAEQISATYIGAGGTPATASYSVPAGGILTVDVNQDTLPLGPATALGAELRLTSGLGGGFLAASVGVTLDGLSATENLAVSN